MLLALLCALALAPVYWAFVPAAARRDVVTAASVIALAVYDLRLAAGLLVLVAMLQLALGLITTRSSGARWAVAIPALGLLLALFLANKLGRHDGGPLPSQGGLAFLGVSYLVLKIAAVVVDNASGARRPPRFRVLLSWLVFLPTYPSGPIEDLDHFAHQAPAFDRELFGSSLQRILFGAAKALVLSHYLGQWADGQLLDLEGSTALQVLLAIWAFTLRFFLDFSGYSDIAIGLAGLYGWRIQENFDSPLIRRNLVQLWQHWHMTLTRWLRVYVFVPVSRTILRHGGERWEIAAVVFAQVATMMTCGLWHGVSWNFALWGLTQGLMLAWVGVAARPVGRVLPPPVLAWWRTSSAAHGLSVFITFNVFSFSNVLVHSTLGQTLRIARHLLT